MTAKEGAVPTVLIRRCADREVATILEVINDAAGAYREVIPADRWNEPYMPERKLRDEIDDGVVFWGYYGDDELVGVMGIQDVLDVTLIRHAYVRSRSRRQGIGSRLLEHLLAESSRPYLIGTWAAATWAIRFYEKHGFRLLSREETISVLNKYWSIPERQIETSVVLANEKWRSAGGVLADAELAARLRRLGSSRQLHLCLPQLGDDLLDRVALPCHLSPFSNQSESLKS